MTDKELKELFLEGIREDLFDADKWMRVRLSPLGYWDAVRRPEWDEYGLRIGGYTIALEISPDVEAPEVMELGRKAGRYRKPDVFKPKEDRDNPGRDKGNPNPEAGP